MSAPISPTFKIIGGDGNEYGPVDLATLQQWTRDGRVSRETRVWDSRTGAWLSASQVAELATILGVATAAPAPPLPPTPAVVGMELAHQICQRGYTAAIGDWFSQGWEFFKANFGFAMGVCWIVFGLTFFVSMVVGMVPCIGPVVQLAFNYVVLPPLVAGLWWTLLLRRRGAPPDVGQVFDGFKRCFGQSVLVNLVTALITLAACIPGGASLIVGILAVDSHPALGIPLIILGIPLILAPCIYVGVSYLFAMPLVADRRMQFWDAMETSRRVVGKHWFSLFAFALLIGLTTLAGTLACCVGLVFALPLVFCVSVCAYENIFSSQT